MTQVEIREPVGGGSTVRSSGARRVVLQLLWLLPCCLVFIAFFAAQAKGLRHVEAMDAAQVARHVAEGDGFTTSFLRPLSLARGASAAGQPDQYNAPLYPLALAVAFNVAGANDRTVAMVATLFGLLTAVLVFVLASRLLDRTAGVLAALLVSLNAGVLAAGVSGTDVAMLGFTLVLLFLLIARHRGTVRSSALCGVAAALAYLTDYSALAVLVPAAALVALRSRASRWQHVAAMLVGFAVIAGPWLVRDWVVAGGPLSTPRARGVVAYSGSYPSTTLLRTPAAATNAPLSFLGAHPREVAKKVLVNLGAAEARTASVLGLALLVLLGLALFVDLGSPAANRLKWGAVAAGALLALNLAIGQPRFDVLYALVGVAAALGAVAFAATLRARQVAPGTQTVAAAALLCLSAFPVALSLLPGARPAKPDRSSLEYLRNDLPRDAVVVTDSPWAVAWYAERTAVWLPQEPAPTRDEQIDTPLATVADTTRRPEFAALARARVQPTAIFLSSDLDAYPAADGMARWQLLRSVLASQVDLLQRGAAKGAPWTPPGWELSATLPPANFLLKAKQGVGARGRGPGARDGQGR
jgi:hypothetical protein